MNFTFVLLYGEKFTKMTRYSLTRMDGLGVGVVIRLGLDTMLGRFALGLACLDLPVGLHLPTTILPHILQQSIILGREAAIV